MENDPVAMVTGNGVGGQNSGFLLASPFRDWGDGGLE